MWRARPGWLDLLGLVTLAGLLFSLASDDGLQVEWLLVRGESRAALATALEMREEDPRRRFLLRTVLEAHPQLGFDAFGFDLAGCNPWVVYGPYGGEAKACLTAIRERLAEPCTPPEESGRGLHVLNEAALCAYPLRYVPVDWWAVRESAEESAAHAGVLVGHDLLRLDPDLRELERWDFDLDPLRWELLAGKLGDGELVTRVFLAGHRVSVWDGRSARCRDCEQVVLAEDLPPLATIEPTPPPLALHARVLGQLGCGLTPLAVLALMARRQRSKAATARGA